MTQNERRRVTTTAKLYREAAVLVRLGDRMRFEGIIGDAIKYVGRYLTTETAGWLLPELENYVHDFGGGPVRAHPLLLDAHDLLTAFRDGGEDFLAPDDLQEVRRLYAQSVALKKYCAADMPTLHDICRRYISVFAEAVADDLGVDNWEVDDILQQRLRKGDLFASPRVQGLLDYDFDLDDYIQIELSDGVIKVKCPEPALDTVFGEYQQSLRNGGAMDAISSGGHLFDFVSMEARTVNGELVAHDCQRFPPDRQVARRLISMTDGLRVLLDPEVALLALKQDFGLKPSYSPHRSQRSSSGSY
ncbi:hypothetical protein [Rhizobium leguminosarum]|uniref:Uncharacterized protein n=1 Tax=Rhizobium leguminosarum TaxID=384 RepID=A0A7M3DWA7_RHILE|nr:hypothetical protein [Rhizobium leguminosarum]TAY52943.1 hypothetical protein ELH90_15565 [Rhizobium leguminosarum]